MPTLESDVMVIRMTLRMRMRKGREEGTSPTPSLISATSWLNLKGFSPPSAREAFTSSSRV